MTTAPRTPATISVVRAPISPLAGPVRAKDSGSRPIEMSQSRLETRPSRLRRDVALLGRGPHDGPRRLQRVEGEAREHELPHRGGQAVAGHGERGERPRDVHEGDVAPREAALAEEHGAAHRADAAGREDDPQVRGRAVQVVLDHERQQHLGRAHEEQVGDGGAGERRPQPDVAADVAQPRADVGGDRGVLLGDRAGPGRHGQQRRRRHHERGGVDREGGARAEHLDEHAAEGRPREAQRDRPHELIQRVGLGQLAGGQHLGDERIEGRARRRPCRRRRRPTSTTMCHSSSAPVSESSAMSPTATPRRTSALDHDAAAVEAVADDAAEEQEGDRRHRHRDADERQRRRRVGQRVDLPRHRHEEDAVAEQRDAHPAPEQAEVAVAQRREQPHAAQAPAVRAALVAMVHRPRAGTLGAQVLDRGVRVHRAREVEALAQVAAEVAQRRPLLGELDALGHDVEVQRLAQRDDRAWPGPTASGVAPAAQERAVHLEDVDGEAAEVAQRRVAGAEVVHARAARRARAAPPGAARRGRCRSSSPSR